MNKLSPEFTRQVLHLAMRQEVLLRAAKLSNWGGRAGPRQGHQESEGPGPGRRRPPRGPSWARWIGPGGRQARPGGSAEELRPS